MRSHRDERGVIGKLDMGVKYNTIVGELPVCTAGCWATRS